jgi:HAD superfamily hydrolase (TIGR01549 family)
MIRLVTFDIGGTILKKEINLPRYERLKEYIDAPREEYKKAYYISKEPFSNFILKHLKYGKKDALENALECMNKKKELIFNENIVKTIENLHNLGYKVATISNANYSTYKSIKDTEVGKYIDKEFYSFDIGDYKPHKNVFLFVQNYYGLKPEEILHIGDSKISDYHGAKEAGWHSYLFTNNFDIDEFMGIIEHLSRTCD